MRLASAVIVAVLGIAVVSSGVAMTTEAAAKPAGKRTKLGCVIGLEKWDAGAGRCVAAKPAKKTVTRA